MIVNVNASDQTEQNFAAVLFLIGLVILFVGLFFMAKRKTPSWSVLTTIILLK